MWQNIFWKETCQQIKKYNVFNQYETRKVDVKNAIQIVNFNSLRNSSNLYFNDKLEKNYLW